MVYEWLGALLAFLLTGLTALWCFAKRGTATLRQKGEVLKGATITVHEVTRIEQPMPGPRVRPADVSDEEFAKSLAPGQGYWQPCTWYRLDVTIIPPFVAGENTLWEPGQLTFVAGYTLPGNVPLEGKVEDRPDAGGFKHSVEVWQENGTWKQYDEENEDGTYDGPQRLRLIVGIFENISSIRFQYYFEVFGLIELPATTES